MIIQKKIRQPIITVAGHVDHGKCVSGDTLIPLTDGTLINAKELFEKNFDIEKAQKIKDGVVQEISDKDIKIFSFDGKNIMDKSISHIWKKKADKLIEIKTSSGDILKTTPEHPFFTFNIDGLEGKRADVLKEGEYITIPKKINIEESDLRGEIIKRIKNIDDFVCFLNNSAENFISLLKKQNISSLERNLKIKHIRDSAKKRRFRIKDFFTLTSFLKILENEAYSMIKEIKNANKGWRVGHTSNTISLPNFKEPEEFGYILGTLAGDGYISNNVILNNNDLEVLEGYMTCLKEIFGINSKVKQAHTCKIVIDEGGLTFSRFLTDVIGFPKKNKSAEVFVPEIVKKNKESFRGFFAGLFDTDGYVSPFNNSIEITSKSKRLIKECSILLLNFDIHSVVYEKNGFFVLRIANKSYLKKFIENFKPRLKRKFERVLNALSKAETSRIFDFFPIKGEILKELTVSGKINRKVPYFNKYIKLNSLSTTFLENALLNLKQENEVSEKIKMLLNMEVNFVKIISKREIKNKEKYVYDFTVPKTHNFIAERILVHNTTILDSIRKTAVADAEAGGITQKISFTKVPLENIKKICPKIKQKNIKLDFPGFLFIDTPGHAAFSNLRKRGGSLADLAILVMDINEGIKPQTIEVIEILKLNKTPFIIALNKIDNISGWRKQSENLQESIDLQSTNTKQQFQEKLLTIIGSLHHHGFNAKPFYEIKDFTAELALVPCSGKTAEGINELIMMLCGLSQKFLKQRLELGKEAKGVILEIKKEKSMQYIEAILYDGILNIKDKIAIASFSEPIISKIRVLEEILPISNKFKPVIKISAANGIRMQLVASDNILPGMPFTVFKNNLAEIQDRFRKEVGEKTQTDEKGIIIKADSLGSLEALITLLRQEKIKIISAGIGKINKKDVISAQTNLREDPVNAIILGFNTEIDKEAKEMSKEKPIKILTDDVIYKLIENLLEFQEQKRNDIKREKLMKLAVIVKLKVLPQYVFHNSNPAIFGVAVEGGTAKQGIHLIDREGEEIAKIKVVQSEGKTMEKAEKGEEVAISLPGIAFDRQLKDTEYLYSNIGEAQYREFKANKELLSQEEISVLQEIAQIKRKVKPTWGV